MAYRRYTKRTTRTRRTKARRSYSPRTGARSQTLRIVIENAGAAPAPLVSASGEAVSVRRAARARF